MKILRATLSLIIFLSPAVAWAQHSQIFTVAKLGNSSEICQALEQEWDEGAESYCSSYGGVASTNRGCMASGENTEVSGTVTCKD